MIPFNPKTARAAKFSALLATALLSTTVAGLAQIPEDQISSKALRQMTKLLKNKATFTTAEEKISSNIAMAARASLFQPTGGSDQLIDRTNVDAAGLATVKIMATRTGNKVLALITNNGGTVLSTDKAHGEIMAKVPLTALATLAADDHILTIDEPDILVTNAGGVTSEGYIGHKANLAVEGLGIDGTGVKVGVLSVSATPATVTALQNSGDLPTGTNFTNLAPTVTGDDEGAAMCEIVHDLAPGAQIAFNTSGTAAGFATAITALATAGCKVICDDVSFYNEGVFQDDIIAQAVNTFVAGGGIYFSSAANSGNLDSGTSGCWEGDFLNGGAATTPITTTEGSTVVANIHNFGTAANPVLYDALTETSTEITLKWSDPLNGGTDDYDLFVLDPTGATVLASSRSRQTGTRAPYEGVASSAGFAVGDRIVIVQYNGTTTVPKTTATRALHLDTNRGALSIGTRGSVYGHNGGANTQTMAATFWDSGHLGTVPFTGAANPVELFSSDGPRAIFYTPAGAQIGTGTPTFASLAAGTAGQTLPKPDFTGADGVVTRTAGVTQTSGLSPFFGTSAASPHGAAIAALVLSANSSLTNTQIRNILLATAMDNMINFNTTSTSSFDPDGGYGVLDAYAAVQMAISLRQ